MATPYGYLEQIAALIKPHVPNASSILHIEAEFKPHPFTLQVAVTPYADGQLFKLSDRRPFAVPDECTAQTQELVGEYYLLMDSLQEHPLRLLRLSVKHNGEFFLAQSFTHDPTLTTPHNIKTDEN